MQSGHLALPPALVLVMCWVHAWKDSFVMMMRTMARSRVVRRCSAIAVAISEVTRVPCSCVQMRKAAIRACEALEEPKVEGRCFRVYSFSSSCSPALSTNCLEKLWLDSIVSSRRAECVMHSVRCGCHSLLRSAGAFGLHSTIRSAQSNFKALLLMVKGVLP